MRTELSAAGRAAGVVLAGLLTTAVQAADVKPAAAPAGPDVLKMVILNGPTTTVHYFSTGLSTSDQASLADLERAENDASYAANLQELRRRYVADELAFDPIRQATQMGLYGKSITRSYSDAFSSAGYGPGYAYPGYYLGYPGAGYASYSSGYSATINHSLANGVGDEGALKTALAQVIASQSTADYATSTARAYSAALNRAAESDGIRTALNLNPRGVIAAGAESARHATVTLKNGEKIEGAIADEDGDWMTIDTAADQVSVRKADVARIDRHRK